MAFLALFQFSRRLIPASEFTILQTRFNGLGSVQNTVRSLLVYILSILEITDLKFFNILPGRKNWLGQGREVPPKKRVGAG